MTPIAFMVWITPVSGQHHTRTRQGHGGQIFHFLTQEGKAYRRAIALQADSSAPASPLEGPLRVALDFYRPRPKQRPAWLEKATWKSGRRFPYRCGKHDLDNLAKPFIDALIGSFWDDDGVITALDLERYYHEAGGAPRVEVRIQEHKEAPCS